MGKIQVNNIKLYANHGCLDEEAKIRKDPMARVSDILKKGDCNRRAMKKLAKEQKEQMKLKKGSKMKTAEENKTQKDDYEYIMQMQDYKQSIRIYKKR